MSLNDKVQQMHDDGKTEEEITDYIMNLIEKNCTRIVKDDKK